MDKKKDLDIEKITDIRSSFRGLKGRDKIRYRSADIIGILIIVSILLGIVISPYWNKTNDDKKYDDKETILPVTKKKIETGSYNGSNNGSNKSGNKGSNKSSNSGSKYSNSSNKSLNITNVNNTVGKIGIPFVSKGFEITIKSVSSAMLYTNVWISVKNIDNKDRPFKIGDESMIIDDTGERYENVVVTGIEIAQTNLSVQSIIEGSVFFKRLKEGRDPKKLILDISGEKVEFRFNRSTI